MAFPSYNPQQRRKVHHSSEKLTMSCKLPPLQKAHRPRSCGLGFQVSWFKSRGLCACCVFQTWGATGQPSSSDTAPRSCTHSLSSLKNESSSPGRQAPGEAAPLPLPKTSCEVLAPPWCLGGKREKAFPSAISSDSLKIMLLESSSNLFQESLYKGCWCKRPFQWKREAILNFSCSIASRPFG